LNEFRASPEGQSVLANQESGRGGYMLVSQMAASKWRAMSDDEKAVSFSISFPIPLHGCP